MNFLSHFFFYKKEDPYFNTGLVLPDLVKSFCKTHLKPKDSYTRPSFQALNNGTKLHLEVDKKFHNSNFFKISTAFISNILDSEANWPRKWFLNHLLTEILMDRVLMDKHENLCNEFYSQLKSVETPQIELYLKLSGVHNYQNFTPGFTRFVDFQFIFDYKHNEKLIFALNRVYKRTGIEYQWTIEDEKLLLKNIPIIIDYLDMHLGSLIEEIK